MTATTAMSATSASGASDRESEAMSGRGIRRETIARETIASEAIARETIAVRLPNWIGDAAMAAPALAALRAARPGVRWILIGSEQSVPLYGRWGADGLLVARDRGLFGPFALARRLRDLSLSEALVLGRSFRAALPFALARVPHRAGLATGGRALLLTDRLPEPDRSRHLAQHYLDLAARLGADPATPLDPSLPIGDDERRAAARRLEAVGCRPETAIGFAPGATYGETKRWPLRSWIDLGSRLASSGFSIAVFGGTAERAAAAAIADALPGAVFPLAGTLAIRQSLAVMSLLRAHVSNDSGAMHLAAASGRPVLGIFGSTNPRWTGPLGPASRALTLGLSCSPCYARRCPTQIECLRDLGAAAVHETLQPMLRDPAAASRPRAGETP
ncbi:MAG: lipopolysaccharide heptosyltransferase II [Candidatus Eisenbacteria bacterium]